MATMKLIVSVAILVLGAASLGSAQWRRQHGYSYQPYYPQQQQRPYQNQYPNGQTGVSLSEAEWVCKNPKTGDMMVIVAEDVPAGQQRPPIGQPGYPNYPQQPNYPQTPTYPSQPATGPTYSTTQPPTQGTPPNKGGEGVIDIRLARN